MSNETREWLSKNVLIGKTDVRGTAWHYRQGDDNHYPGFIPVGDVERRLFGFEPVERQIAILKPVTGLPPRTGAVFIDGQSYEVVIDPEHKAITADTDDLVLGVHGADYQIHSYRQWLLQNVANILDDDLGISSAGLLRRRAQAWVEVSVPENVETPEGVTFRPNLLCFTSLDASLATTYKRTIGLVVCDNTLALRIGEQGEEIRIRHTSGSSLRIGEARQALNLLHQAADEFSAQIHELCSVEITVPQWRAVLEALVPVKEKEGRSLTIAEKKRDALTSLYRFDPRCAPWQGTKFGVIQTYNTYQQHQATIRNTHGGGRVERNLVNTITGKTDLFDARVAEAVDLVLAAA